MSTTEAHPSFNLVDEPWIRVLRADRRLEQVSIRETLRRAHELLDLAGEVPTQDPPVLRLLLAVLHRALGGPSSRAAWKALWDQPVLPADEVDAYLDAWRHRFDLFDPETPFFQVADLQSTSGGTFTTALLIPYLASGNNVPLFGGRRDDQPPELAPAEAARWLLHVHAWDTGGIKTGARGDARVKGGKTYGNPVGLLGMLGVTYPVGQTLRETLLLNLLPADLPHFSLPGADDAPVWERPPVGVTWGERLPTGLTDLYTWQSRRVRLVPSVTAGAVTVRHVLVAAGDRVPRHDLFRIEPHTAWKRSRDTEKREKRAPIYVPKVHDPDRQLWRGMASLLAVRRIAMVLSRGADAPSEFAPMCLDWLADLVDRGWVAWQQLLRLRAVGIRYGTQSAVVDEAISDSLPLPVRLLADQDDGRVAVALEAVADVEAAATALRALAHNLYRAEGGKDDGQSRRAAEEAARQLYAGADPAYRRLLRALDADVLDPDGVQAAWERDVRHLAETVAAGLLDEASPAAFRGRMVRQGATEQIVNAPKAERWFRGSLAKALPRAHRTAQQRVMAAGGG